MKTKTFVLWQDHSHAGKRYKAGDTITLPVEAYEFMLKATREARGEIVKELAEIQGSPVWLEKFEAERSSKKSKAEGGKE